MPPLMLARPRSTVLEVCAGSDDGNESSTNKNTVASRMQPLSFARYLGHGLVRISLGGPLRPSSSIASGFASQRNANCKLRNTCDRSLAAVPAYLNVPTQKSD